MVKNYFGFIPDTVLSTNINTAFLHVLDLDILSRDTTVYNKTQRSSFRKTIIIYTASIIEALLLYKIKLVCDTKKITSKTWKLKNKKVAYNVSDKHKIIFGDYILHLEEIKINKLNLGQINDLAKEYKIISKELYKEIDKVRKLRNRQHIGTHLMIEKDYNKRDLEFIFSVASKIKDLCK